VRVTFGEHDGKTKLIHHQVVFESVAGRDAHREGWGECLDRLEGYLRERSQITAAMPR
jgi:Activator of Hsp90 ATPase homolog 1-like protein